MAVVRTARRARSGRAGARADLWSDLLSRRTPLTSLYACDAMERVALVKAGVPAQLVVLLAEDMGITRDRLYRTIGLARATVDRKVRERKRLNPDESERVLGIARLVGQVDQMVRESGDPERAADFDAAKWVAAWLDGPLPALGGERPASLMDTAEGRAIVSGLLAQTRSGAYA